MTSRNHNDDEDLDDQTEEGTMSFLDHLDELRTRLVRIALFVVIGFVVCWVSPTRFTISFKSPSSAWSQLRRKVTGA